MRAGLTSLSAGLIASVLAHLMLIVAVTAPHQRQTAHGETVAVELVPADEAPAFNDQPQQDATSQQPSEPPKPEAQPDWSQLEKKPPAPEADARKSQPQQQQQAQQRQQQQQAQQQAQAQQQQQQQAQQQQQQPQPLQQPEPPQQQEQPAEEQKAETPENPIEQGARLAAMLGLPPPGEGTASASDVNADIKSDEMAAFKAHLKKCWKVPAGYAENQKIKVIVRIMLRRDGRLSKDPEAVEVAPASLAFPSYSSAIAAIKQCQPYTMLPADKYNEWRVLDLNVSPDQMMGG